MSEKPVVIDIDMDKACSKCRKKGATPNGMCLNCTAKSINTGITRPGNRRITKVKRKKAKDAWALYFEWEQEHADGLVDKMSMACMDEAMPGFHTAFDALALHAIREAELSEDMAFRTKVSSVSLSYGGEKKVMGAVITASIEMRHANCPLNINTPHKPSEPYTDSENDTTPCLCDETVNALLILVHQANKYLDGERQQTKLDLQPPEKSDVAGSAE